MQITFLRDISLLPFCQGNIHQQGTRLLLISIRMTSRTKQIQVKIKVLQQSHIDAGPHMSLDMRPVSFEGANTERLKKRQGNAVVSKLERPIGKARRTDIYPDSN